MPGSLASEGSQRTALGLYQPTTVPTDASSRATSPVPISNRGSDPQRAISPAPSRATSPAPKPKRRPSVQRQPTTNTSFSHPHMDGLLSRVLDEEDKFTARLREQINQLAQELKLRTEALEQAYVRVEQADKRTVETHNKYLAEAAARAKAESDSRKTRAENMKALAIVDMWREELDRVKAEVERLEAEKDEAQSEAKKAQAVAKELKRSTKVDRTRDNRAPDDRGTDERKREKEQERERAIAAAVRDAYERGKAEGEASATMKALAAFDKLMDNDELNEWDDNAKQTTRNEIKDLSKKPNPERAKSPEPSPPKSKRSFMRS